MVRACLWFRKDLHLGSDGFKPARTYRCASEASLELVLPELLATEQLLTVAVVPDSAGTNSGLTRPATPANGCRSHRLGTGRDVDVGAAGSPARGSCGCRPRAPGTCWRPKWQSQHPLEPKILANAQFEMLKPSEGLAGASAGVRSSGCKPHEFWLLPAGLHSTLTAHRCRHKSRWQSCCLKTKDMLAQDSAQRSKVNEV